MEQKTVEDVVIEAPNKECSAGIVEKLCEQAVRMSTDSLSRGSIFQTSTLISKILYPIQDRFPSVH